MYFYFSLPTDRPTQVSAPAHRTIQHRLLVLGRRRRFAAHIAAGQHGHGRQRRRRAHATQHVQPPAHPGVSGRRRTCVGHVGPGGSAAATAFHDRRGEFSSLRCKWTYFLRLAPAAMMVKGKGSFFFLFLCSNPCIYFSLSFPFFV